MNHHVKQVQHELFYGEAHQGDNSGPGMSNCTTVKSGVEEN